MSHEGSSPSTLGDLRRETSFLEIVMITGQTAYLAMVVIGMLSLPLALLWAVIYTNPPGRGGREGTLAHVRSPKVADHGARPTRH